MGSLDSKIVLILHYSRGRIIISFPGGLSIRYLPTFLLLFLLLVACAPSSLFATPTATFTPSPTLTPEELPEKVDTKNVLIG